jgi:predicted DNA binding CopG/RHH family protein
MRPVQYFSDEYLAHARKLSTEEIVEFVENFRQLHSATGDKSKLISIKIPESLLRGFRNKCAKRGLKYQAQIKQLMKRWVEENE